nr:rhomboid serine protease type 4.2 [Babesia bovis]|eukprot:XP_001610125.1 hypothetical protein [Babesia bovis T2Bo]
MIFSLVLNKTTFDGKCMGNVDFGYGTLGHPFHSPLGYNACTQNTKTKIIEPNFHIHQNTEGQQVLVWKENERWHDRISEPGSQSLTVLGAVDTNHIRIYGEWFRIFTGIILHAGWFHLLNNALIHFIVLYIIEPEWGFYRTLLGYFVTGCGSYLAGAVFIPCLRQIGSSGVHFGFIGAIAPYCVENWYRMGSPVIVLSLSLLVPLLDLCIKEADIGIQIHLVGFICLQGGYIFGMLYGFSTIKAVTLFDKGVPYYRFTIKFFSRWLKESTRNLYIRKVVKACQIEEMNRIQYENQAKSSTCGFFFMKRLFGVYPLGPYRMRPRDWVTRGISFCLMVILMTFLILMLCFEPLYSSFNPTVSSAFTQTCICCYIKIRNKSALQRLQVLDLAGKYFCFRSKEYANRYCF